MHCSPQIWTGIADNKHLMLIFTLSAWFHSETLAVCVSAHTGCCWPILAWTQSTGNDRQKGCRCWQWFQPTAQGFFIKPKQAVTCCAPPWLVATGMQKQVIEMQWTVLLSLSSSLLILREDDFASACSGDSMYFWDWVLKQVIQLALGNLCQDSLVQ